MASINTAGTDRKAIADITACLALVRRNDLKSDMPVAERVRAIGELMASVRSLGRQATGSHVSAREAVLAYLLANVGEVVRGTDLETVSGISEYARRVRELRTAGWQIVCGSTAPSASERRALKKAGIVEKMEASEYILLTDRIRAVRVRRTAV